MVDILRTAGPTLLGRKTLVTSNLVITHHPTIITVIHHHLSPDSDAIGDSE